MFYKITSVYNKDGFEKTDDMSMDRLGRIIDVDHSVLIEGHSALFYCVNPGFDKSVVTSIVQAIEIDTDKIYVWTLNSCYELSQI